MKIVCAIVLYNKRIVDSKTYQSIKNQGFDQIIIFDNSNTKQPISGVKYLCYEQNYGLSRAYNCIKEYLYQYNYDYIVLFDDDSYVEANFLSKLKNEKLFDLNFPIVYDNNVIAPSFHHENQLYEYIVKKASFLFENKKWYKKRLCSINSGMIISSAYFNNYFYDEKLFLDCVDYNFIRDYRLTKKEIGYTKCQIYQSFHFNEKQDLNQIQSRIEIRLNDLEYYSKKHYKINKLFILLLYTFKMRTLKFIKENYGGT